VILFVGRIDWVKNLDLLIEALRIVREARPSAMLVLAGPDCHGHRAELETRARALGIQEHVLFTGLLAGTALKSAYARGNVLALVSKKENFGLAAAEGLACGLPVVLSEGVGLDIGASDSGPLARVEATSERIAGALLRMLRRQASTGLPDPDARCLAEMQFDATYTCALQAFSPAIAGADIPSGQALAEPERL
jgi:glycosyltransferase involved in cell wall biosynthesis